MDESNDWVEPKREATGFEREVNCFFAWIPEARKTA